MKFFSFILFLLVSFSTVAQHITGDWYGILQFPGVKLRLVLHISGERGQYQATLDSPDQGAKGIQAASCRYDSLGLDIQFPLIQAYYKGRYENEELKGTFTQMNRPIALNFNRQEIKQERPQEPKPPFPYYSEEVIFQNSQAGISLAGTLTLPQKEGCFPAVILISGSDPQNRDEELMGHKPFLVLSDYLTRRGIAVLRFDDRGVGQSQGVFAQATTQDFATDVEAAVNYLKSRKEIRTSAIGLVGHSEGGLIAPMVAAEDQSIGFIVLLAGVGFPGKELLVQQNADILRAGNVSPEYIEKISLFNQKAYAISIDYPKDQARGKLDSLFRSELPFLTDGQNLTAEQKEQFIQKQLNILISPWFRGLLVLEPASYLSRVKCPVLALNGAKDLQVNAEKNLTAIYEILHKNGNQQVDTLRLTGLNHLFQNCNTGSPAEYAFIEETFSPEALKIITQWIIKTVK